MYEEFLKLPNFLAGKCILYVKNSLFVRQKAIWEHFLGFTKQYLLVLIT